MVGEKINILFICTGNICRSPMAEYLFRSRMEPDLPWSAGSAGLAAVEGLPASQMAIQVMNDIGINLAPHRSRPVTKELIDETTIILVMTNSHASEIKACFPGARDRVHLLKSFNPNAKDKNIPDPVGLTLEIYRRTLSEISDCIEGLIGYLRSLQENKQL